MPYPLAIDRRRRGVTVLLLAGAFSPALLHAQAARPAAQTVRLRGTIRDISAQRMVLHPRSGDDIELAIAPDLMVTEVYPIRFEDIKPGSFVGVGGMPQPDGTQRAIAVTVFPENLRGAGEGHRPFDFLPQSTMTNATVGAIAAAPTGRQLKLVYPGGEQTIVVPPDAPVVSMRPGGRDLLVPGAVVAVSAQQVAGLPTAVRISAGRSGFAPPY